MTELVGALCVVAGATLVALKEQEKEIDRVLEKQNELEAKQNELSSRLDSLIDDRKELTNALARDVELLDQYEWDEDELAELTEILNDLKRVIH